MAIMKNIPVMPTANTRYEFNRMEVGDCVKHPAGGQGSDCKAAAAARAYGRANGKVFVARGVDGGENVMIWRTE